MRRAGDGRRVGLMLGENIRRTRFDGFMGKPGSALMLVNVLEMAVEAQGGRVTVVSACDYEYQRG
ncbi:hypothetical protein [Adlercreutzia faecimuris]|uniref:Uncharacterized protein n=1 Tax=Adlercreutzia faecimuris TaxID=2897341 RepID=A0ABS9WH40_9ACTN|nr:hypothetical protein [Adlercreutzia sp. JBNU-10]MCI2242187.1 hypothetical protein [Adlercreutzia sp. JBNU-10]